MGGTLFFTYKIIHFSKFLIKMWKDCVKTKNLKPLPINNYYSHSNLIFKREFEGESIYTLQKRLFKKYSFLHEF